MLDGYRGESDAAIEKLAAGGPASKQIFDALVRDADRMKPDGYDAHQIRVRHYYEGKAGADPYLGKALQARFPATYTKLPRVSLNVTKQIASIDAASYDHPVKRSIKVNGEEIEQDDPRAVAFADLCRSAGLHKHLPELDRRVQAARTMFVRVGWDALKKRPRVDLFWPHDVRVICHAKGPDDLTYATCLIARVAGPVASADSDPGDTHYEVWTRPVVAEDERTGEVTFGAWRRDKVNGRGEAVEEFVPTDEEGKPIASGRQQDLDRLPWCVLRNGIPSGCVFVDEDRDLVETQDVVNVGWSNIFYTLDMEAHSEAVYAGNREISTMVGGPGVMHKIDTGETLTTLDFNPKIADMLATQDKFTKTLLLSRRCSPDAAATEPGVPLSGVSRRIANEPQDKARRERQNDAREFEEEQLLPLMVAISDLYGETSIGGEDVSYHAQFSDPPDFEEPEAKERRIMALVDDGYISKAEALVEMGRAEDVEEAQQKIDAIAAEREKNAPPMVPGFGAEDGEQQPPPSRFARRLAAKRGEVGQRRGQDEAAGEEPAP